MVKINTEVIKQRVAAKHGKSIVVLSEFVDWPTKMKFKCAECKGTWESKPQNVCNGSRCPHCRTHRVGAVISAAKIEGNGAQRRTRFYSLKLKPRLKQQQVEWVGGTARFSHSLLELTCKPCGFEFERQVRHILVAEHLCPCCHDTTYREMLKRSPIADRWLDSIERKLGRTLKREVHIPGTLYRADGFDPRTRTVYEFYGDAWHGNPAVYHPNQSCHPFKKVKARELYAATLAKEETLKGLGYKVVSIGRTTTGGCHENEQVQRRAQPYQQAACQELRCEVANASHHQETHRENDAGSSEVVHVERKSCGPPSSNPRNHQAAKRVEVAAIPGADHHQ